MPKRLVPSSLLRARKQYREGDDPLTYLLPWEAKAAEVYVRVGLMPEATSRKGDPYADVFNVELLRAAPELPSNMFYVKRLRANPAWMAYVQYLKAHARDKVLDTLHGTAFRAADTYVWAQEEARKVGDYAEARKAAGDHLDRIGATEKPPTTTVQIATINLRSRNFDTENLLAESPALEGEVVKPDDANPAG